MRRPTRWLDPGGDAPQGARELLAAASAPDAAARARVWSALGATTGAPLPELSPLAKGAGVKTAAAAGATTKVMIASASLVAALGAGGATWRAGHPPVPTAPTTRTPTAHGVGSPRHDARRPAFVTPPASSAAPRALPPPGPLGVRAPRAVAPRTAALPPAWSRRPVAARQVLARVVPAADAPPPSPSLAEEIALLAEMRSASGDAPARCLDLARAHADRFGDRATLAHEREALALAALHALGRDGEALPRAEAFLRAHPTSTVAPRVRALRDTMEAQR